MTINVFDFLESQVFDFKMSWLKGIRVKRTTRIRPVVIGTLHPFLMETAKMVFEKHKTAQFRAADVGRVEQLCFQLKESNADSHSWSFCC